MRHGLFVPLGSLLLCPAAARGQILAIEHQPVACATAERFPRLEARLSPAESVASARVVFQGQTADWYSVAMKPENGAFAGVLPKPKKDLKSFRYYIEVTDSSLGTRRTSEYAVTVVDSASACRGKTAAGALSTASVILQGPAGVAAVPAGFASGGVVAGSAAGSSAGAAGAAATGGGGLSTGAIVGIVAGVGGAAAAGVVVASKGDEGSSAGTSYSGPVSGQYVKTQDIISPVGTPPKSCLHAMSFSGNITVRLDSSSGAVRGEMKATVNQSETGVSGGATCSSPGPGGSLSFNCSLSGTSTDFSCSEQITTTAGIQTNTETRSFSGSLSGGAIVGAFSYAVRGQSAGVNSGGNYTTTDSGSFSVPVTLR
jgi:hypothetical protein